jgi:hypothetical protein
VYCAYSIFKALCMRVLSLNVAAFQNHPPFVRLEIKIFG